MPLKPWVKNNPPIQYQKGFAEFYKLSFKLTPDVLIPRPETELLVDEAIAFLKNLDIQHKFATIIDVGTGSGCIAISIAKNLPNVKVFAVDKSEKALEVAIDNARINKVSDRVLFLQSDLLSSFSRSVITSEAKQSKPDLTPTKIASPSIIRRSPQNDKIMVDIIVANLPYIPTAKLMHIDPLVRDFEPRIALDGGLDGLELYRKLFSQIKESNLMPKLLLCEIDEDQSQVILSETRKYFPTTQAEIKKDLFGRDRILRVRA